MMRSANLDAHCFSQNIFTSLTTIITKVTQIASLRFKRLSNSSTSNQSSVVLALASIYIQKPHRLFLARLVLLRHVDIHLRNIFALN